jgi:hypothetical protein
LRKSKWVVDNLLPESKRRSRTYGVGFTLTELPPGAPKPIVMGIPARFRIQISRGVRIQESQQGIGLQK